MLALRRQYRRGQDWIGPQAAVPARTVAAILRRHGVPYLRECDPLTGEVIRASKTTTVSYERSRPGELVHMDVKKIGRIPDGGGWKAHGRAATDPDKWRRRLGYDYVHAVVDDYSRFAYCEILPDEKGATCAGFLRRAAAVFAAAGIPRIERVMTDNHFSYTRSAELQAVLREELGAKHKLIRPHCPWQNGKVERFNRTLATEWAYSRVFTSNTDRAQALTPWLQHYNTERRHTALGAKPPTSRLS